VGLSFQAIVYTHAILAHLREPTTEVWLLPADHDEFFATPEPQRSVADVAFGACFPRRMAQACARFPFSVFCHISPCSMVAVDLNSKP
jgi:hypothetical protein